MKTVINITSASFAVIQLLREGCWVDVKDKLAAPVKWPFGPGETKENTWFHPG